jgi:hypothetical protein
MVQVMKEKKFMGKIKLIIITMFIGLGINAQIYNPTKGEIVFREISKIIDRKMFDETMKVSKQKFKESLKKSLLKEENNTGREKEIEQMVELSSNMLDTTAFLEDSTQTYKQKFDNATVVNFLLQNNEIINEYDATDLPLNSLIIKISEDRKSKKTISGYDCYKVTYEYKENNEYADEDYKIYAENTIYKREMWVTDKIKSLYHPVIYEKAILEKYYPLDILETQSDIKGFERRFRLEKIELK